ncbi:hypothetical protein ScPMuIL_002367 [Solemya velum]
MAIKISAALIVLVFLTYTFAATRTKPDTISRCMAEASNCLRARYTLPSAVRRRHDTKCVLRMIACFHGSYTNTMDSN